MDKNEYYKNQKEQKKEFKNYRKFWRKILIWGAVAVASALIIPYSTMYSALKGLGGLILGGETAELVATNATFFIQWGLAAAGAIGALVNGWKASSSKAKIENLQSEEEDLIDGFINENDNVKSENERLKSKVESLEKKNTKTKTETRRNTNTIDLSKNNSSYTEEEINTKKHTK